MKTLKKLILTATAAIAGLSASAQGHNPPEIKVDKASTCAGEAVEFKITCSSKILYAHTDFGDGRDSYSSINDEGSNTLLHSYTVPGTYKVKVYVMYIETSGYTKSDEVEKEITVGELPSITLVDDKAMAQITAETDVEATFKWFQGKKEMQNTASTLFYLESGTYSATATSASGCSASDTIVVKYIQPGDSETDVVNINVVNNVITPGNRDGINDVLYIMDVADFENPCEVSVYNRWGKLVYSNSNYTNTDGFQGKDDSGNELFAGTYYYVVKSKGRKGAAGFVDIIR